MKRNHKRPRNLTTIIFCIFITLFGHGATGAEQVADDGVSGFINHMVKMHGFDSSGLKSLLTKTKIQESILKAIQSPYEAKPWHEYRAVFLSPSRIKNGVKFWRKNETVLSKTSSQYGVPTELMVAIIGVETQYGGYTGAYPVLDALFTLAFHYPKRSPFFRSELEHFLLLCREEQIDPTTPKGSYAGAMGIPQFMPSSFRRYAVDNDNDHRRDIWNNVSDAIASVANYFVKHGWQQGQPVVFNTAVKGNEYKAMLEKGLIPNYSVEQLHRHNVVIPASLDPQLKARLFEFEEKDGASYWLGLNNFYVITRYNHSAHYAMAVYQLAQAILTKRNQS